MYIKGHDENINCIIYQIQLGLKTKSQSNWHYSKETSPADLVYFNNLQALILTQSMLLLGTLF